VHVVLTICACMLLARVPLFLTALSCADSCSD